MILIIAGGGGIASVKKPDFLSRQLSGLVIDRHFSLCKNMSLQEEKTNDGVLLVVE